MKIILNENNKEDEMREFLEKQRIKFHLMRVEMKLRRKDISSLSSQQKANRAVLLDALHYYWKRENFPQNIDYSRKFLPHFRDHRGVLCAVGYLICVSGEENLVDEIYKTNNLVRIKEINQGPVVEWLDKSGFTKEEAAEIQPAYGWIEPSPPSPLPVPTPSLPSSADILPLVLFVSAGLFFCLELVNSKFISNLKVNKNQKGKLQWYFRALSILASIGFSYLLFVLI